MCCFKHIFAFWPGQYGLAPCEGSRWVYPRCYRGAPTPSLSLEGARGSLVVYGWGLCVIPTFCYKRARVMGLLCISLCVYTCQSIVCPLRTRTV